MIFQQSKTLQHVHEVETTKFKPSYMQALPSFENLGKSELELRNCQSPLDGAVRNDRPLSAKFRPLDMIR
jgi:hypothetical protein